MPPAKRITAEDRALAACRRLLKARLKLFVCDHLKQGLTEVEAYPFASVVQIEAETLREAESEWLKACSKWQASRARGKKNIHVIVGKAYASALSEVLDIFEDADKQRASGAVQDFISKFSLTELLP